MELIRERSEHSSRDHLEDWAFLLALSYRLQDIPMAQSAATIWFSLCSPIWDPQSGACRIQTCPKVLDWAAKTSSAQNKSIGSLDEMELVRLIAEWIAGLVADLAKRRRLASASVSEFFESIRRELPNRRSVEAIAQLVEAGKSTSLNQIRFEISDQREDSSTSIAICRYPEVTNIDDYRVRPHQFCWKGDNSAHYEIERLYVGQICEQISTNPSGHLIEWDTIVDNNACYPFWPSTLNHQNGEFSHRCSVRRCTDGITWSDWPQIDTTASFPERYCWRFVTGVFHLRSVGGISTLSLLSKLNWQINWR